MNDAHSNRFSFFGLVALVMGGVAVAVIGCGVHREMVQKADNGGCRNNLRQLALAMHEYHDVHRRLPPFTVFNSDDYYAGWLLMITPYLDGRETYNAFSLYDRGDSEVNLPTVEGFRANYAQCPVRSNAEVYDFPGTFQTNTTNTDFRDVMPTDYVAAHSSGSVMWSRYADGMIINPRFDTASGFPQASTSLGSATDGATNTALIGEKHMHPRWIGAPVTTGGSDGIDAPALLSANSPAYIRFGGDMTAFGEMTLAPFADYDANLDAAAIYMFGSWHQGYTNFANADASVRSVDNTIDLANLRRFLSRDDKEATEILDRNPPQSSGD